jgi:signal transduction histidine kinase
MPDALVLAPLLAFACALLILYGRRQVQAVSERESSTRRLLGLAAQETRTAALALRGHAEHLRDFNEPQAATLATSAWQLLTLATDLEEQAHGTARAHTLREEEVDLRAVMADAVAVVAASISPGQRNWKLPHPAGPMIGADLRAIRHVLISMATEAAQNTVAGDWIEFSVRPNPDGISVVCEDEGRGPAKPAATATHAADSRGVGLRLALARSLMDAHGGRLDIESVPGVGTRVTLIFPASRVISR